MATKNKATEGWEEIVLIRKTSDDSLCPLFGDYSLINTAAERLSVGQVRKAFPLLCPPLQPK